MAEPHLVGLPEHVLIQIFSNMTYSEISKCREVCQTFNRICSQQLTNAFIRVDRLHSQIQKNIKSQLPRKESERRNHALSRFVDVLSALETRLSLLSMTYTKYIDLDLCCFIPGLVLDELYQLLHRLQNTETQPPRAYDLLQSLRDLSTMAMEHFEEHIVPLLKVQMTQTALFSSNSNSSSSPLHSSITSGHMVSSPLDGSGMSMLDCSWPMPLSTITSPWRRTPLKLDVQRMQSQMQIHSAAIATMTKEYREQKVKIGEQNRIIAEQERQIQDQRRLILELKAHTQAQEKNLETLASHMNTVTGKVVPLPETKAWDHTLWDQSLRASTSSQDCTFASDMDSFSDVVDKGLERKSSRRQPRAEYGGEGDLKKDARPRVAPSQRGEGRMRHLYHSKQAASCTITSEDQTSAEQFVLQTNDLHQSLSSKCSTKRLLAQIALAIQHIAADHSLPVCLDQDESPKGKASDPSDSETDIGRQLAVAQEQLSTFNEEHVNCSVCATEDSMPTSSYLQRSETRGDPQSPVSPSVANQGLVNRAQELYNRLTNLIEKTMIEPCASTVMEGPAMAEVARDKGKGKGPLKRKRPKGEVDRAEVATPPQKLRKCRRRI